MSNILDYIKWRGDLTIQNDPFNEIDSLILSRFSYLPFDGIIGENEVVTIRELNERFQKQDKNNINILWDDDINLFPLMGNSKRFGEMKATKYSNKLNIEEELQFSAITILVPDDTIFISYRGTDNTIVGWKEDFNMGFKSHVGAQIDSVKYLEEIADKYPKNNIRIGGHSKGGNLAVYSAVFATEKTKNRIIKIYNNDGPGFDDEISESNNYKQMITKVNTYIPQESIFGMLLNHKEKYIVVRSIQKGFMQHDVYSWQLLGKNFECLKEVTNGSKFIDKSIKDWFKQIDIKQREQMIDIIFEVINSTQMDTMSDIKAGGISSITTILKSYKMIDAEDKKMLLKTVSALLKTAKDNFLELNKLKNEE